MTFDYQTLTQSSSRHVALVGTALGEALGWAWLRYRAWSDRNRQRHALADLDDRLLRDIGVSRAAAAWEASKAFWHY